MGLLRRKSQKETSDNQFRSQQDETSGLVCVQLRSQK